MARNKRFATSLEKEVIPFIKSLEDYFSASGIPENRIRSHAEMRSYFETAVPIIRGGGHLWAPLADAVIMKLDDLQHSLPQILEKMPDGFTLQWNAILGRLAKDNQAMLEGSLE